MYRMCSLLLHRFPILGLLLGLLLALLLARLQVSPSMALGRLQDRLHLRWRLRSVGLQGLLGLLQQHRNQADQQR
jgi:hypothetical protein